MTSVSATRAAPARTPDATPRPDPRAPDARAPDAADVRAMGDAFARARARMPAEGAAPRGGAPGKAGVASEAPRDAALFGEARDRAGALPGDERHALHREDDRDERGPSNGQSFAGQAAAPVVGAPAMPAPHVDPGAFAQMLADLWTRENGKGAREVSVRFGRDAWPATGARLVRNAAGTLDIALEVADGERDYAGRLPGLARHLRDAGVAVGALAVG